MKKSDVRKKIIKAAVKIFTQRGFFETRIEDISKCAGVAKGTVYLYFKDKPSLYAGIIAEHFDDAVALLERTIKSNVSPTEKLTRLAEDWIGYMLRFKNSFGIQMLDNANLTSHMMKVIHRQAFARVAEIIDLVGQIIRDGIEQGEFCKMDPCIGAFHFLNSIRSAFTAHLFIPQAKNVDKEIIRLMLVGLKKH